MRQKLYQKPNGHIILDVSGKKSIEQIAQEFSSTPEELISFEFDPKIEGVVEDEGVLKKIAHDVIRQKNIDELNKTRV